MKTLVIVSIPGSCLSLDLNDFPAGAPQEGRSYELEGKIYRVTEVIETLGCRDLQGGKLSSDMRLLQFADAVAGDDQMLKQQIVKPKPVGKNSPEASVTKGGIILPAAESKDTLACNYEHLVFVRTELQDSPLSAAGRLRPLRLIQNDEQLEAGAEVEAAEGG